MARASTQPVRLSADVIEATKEQGKAAGRSLPAEAELRLRESLARGAWADVERTLTPRASAIGRLVGFVSNELLSYAPHDQQTEYLSVGVGRLLERLAGKTIPPQPEHDAATMADYWWLRLVNAHEPAHRDGKPLPLTLDQQALLELRQALSVAPKNATAPRSQRKERK